MTALSGHYWTVAPVVRALLRPPAAPPGEPFGIDVVDPTVGRVRLTGVLHAPGAATTLLVALHGLGGSIESSYLKRFASAAVGRGYACLRFDLRGAGGDSADFYHAGLTSDLAAVLAAPRLASFSQIVLVGFSLGGQLALRWAGELEDAGDPRLAAVAGVCSPLDLDLGAGAIDAWFNAPYRAWILSGLCELADRVERFRPLPVDRAARRRIATIREWDTRIVAPRWGFASAEDYYRKVSAAGTLGGIRRPSWIVLAQNDPMVPPATVRAALERASAAVEVTWTRRGGHVGFPAHLDLGQPDERGLAGQLLGWIESKVPQTTLETQLRFSKLLP